MTDARKLLRQIEAARNAVLDEGRPKAIAKRRRHDMLTARERIDVLLDAGSFRELGALVEPNRDNELNQDIDAPADGLIVGTGTVDGRYVNVMAQDFTVHGGSSGVVGGRKLDRLVQRSVERGLPLICLLEGGGHRIQDGMNSAHFAGASPVFRNFVRLSGWVPIVACMLGQGFAGPTNYAALADFVIMVRGKATMGMAGPALVRAGTGQEISKEELGGATRQSDQQGIADLAVDSEEECLAAARTFLAYLPSNAQAPMPISACDDPINRRDDELLELVPADSRKIYDVRKVIEVIADAGSVFEIKPGFARNLVTSFARLNGRPVGIFANQPLRKGGILDAPSCEKGAHFIALCDAFGLPLVSLIDVPGFSIGESAEDSGLGRRSGRMFFELGIATVPLVSVVLRKGYGGGYFAMAGGRSFDADAAFAWPTAEICAMSIEGAVDVAFRKDYENADDPEAARQAIVERIRTQTTAISAGHNFGIDDIIDPRHTRQFLIETFASAPARKTDKRPPHYRPISPI
ncbi:MAG: acyl-CoA carboxylase subunit beta [Hyphomicrobiaceae bacterium]